MLVALSYQHLWTQLDAWVLALVEISRGDVQAFSRFDSLILLSSLITNFLGSLSHSGYMPAYHQPNFIQGYDAAFSTTSTMKAPPSLVQNQCLTHHVNMGGKTYNMAGSSIL